MDPEVKSLLEETKKLAKENNDILRSIRRSQRFSSLMRLVYWVILIGVSVGLFYYLEPYFDGIMDAYSSINGSGILKNLSE